MTPQLEAAIAAIQPLSAIERQQLLQILLCSHTTDLGTQSREFWNDTSIQQLRANQTPKPYSPDDRIADFWPQDDSIDDFLAFLQQQRNEKSFTLQR